MHEKVFAGFTGTFPAARAGTDMLQSAQDLNGRRTALPSTRQPKAHKGRVCPRGYPTTTTHSRTGCASSGRVGRGQGRAYRQSEPQGGEQHQGFWNKRQAGCLHSENAGLKLNIQKTKIMASGPITSWQIDGEKMATVTNFIFGDPKSTADCDFSHEIKKCFLLGRKAMTNLDSILKSRDITLLTNCIVKAMVFPVVMYGCESWTIKKAEC